MNWEPIQPTDIKPGDHVRATHTDPIGVLTPVVEGTAVERHTSSKGKEGWKIHQVGRVNASTVLDVVRTYEVSRPEEWLKVQPMDIIPGSKVRAVGIRRDGTEMSFLEEGIACERLAGEPGWLIERLDGSTTRVLDSMRAYYTPPTQDEWTLIQPTDIRVDDVVRAVRRDNATGTRTIEGRVTERNNEARITRILTNDHESKVVCDELRTYYRRASQTQETFAEFEDRIRQYVLTQSWCASAKGDILHDLGIPRHALTDAERIEALTNKAKALVQVAASRFFWPQEDVNKAARDLGILPPARRFTVTVEVANGRSLTPESLARNIESINPPMGITAHVEENK